MTPLRPSYRGLMRVQTACRLTVRLTWQVGAWTDETYGCVEDVAMAITMARFSSANADPAIRRLLSVETSPSGGRYHPWQLLDLS